MNNDARIRAEERRREVVRLKKQGLKQKEIAQKLGISEGAVSQILKRAETGGEKALERTTASGRPPRLTLLNTHKLMDIYDKGAKAVGFPDDGWDSKRLQTVIGEDFHVQLSLAQIRRVMRENGRSLGRQSEQQDDKIDLPVEGIIEKADKLQHSHKFIESTLQYEKALPLFRNSLERAQFIVDHLIVPYLSLCDFERIDDLLGETETLLEDIDGNNEIAPIQAKISELRGWSEGYRGNFRRGIEYFLLERPQVQKLGDEICEARTFHFEGRFIIENQLLNEFDTLPNPAPRIGSIVEAIRSLQLSESIHSKNQDEAARNFDLLWQARGLILQGNSQARRLINQASGFFREIKMATGEGNALLERAKLIALDNVADGTSQISRILLDTLAGTEHPYVVALAFNLWAYYDLHIGEYRRNKAIRERVLDKCNLVQQIYPYEYHPIYQIAASMKVIIELEMNDAELYHYKRTLKNRMEERKDEKGQYIFYWLDNFPQRNPDTFTRNF